MKSALRLLLGVPTISIESHETKLRKCWNNHQKSYRFIVHRIIRLTIQMGILTFQELVSINGFISGIIASYPGAAIIIMPPASSCYCLTACPADDSCNSPYQPPVQLLQTLSLDQFGSVGFQC